MSLRDGTDTCETRAVAASPSSPSRRRAPGARAARGAEAIAMTPDGHPSLPRHRSPAANGDSAAPSSAPNSATRTMRARDVASPGYPGAISTSADAFTRLQHIGQGHEDPHGVHDDVDLARHPFHFEGGLQQRRRHVLGAKISVASSWERGRADVPGRRCAASPSWAWRTSSARRRPLRADRMRQRQSRQQRSPPR